MKIVSGSANITIRIIDLNDNAPIFDQSSEEFTVKELATKDTFVGVVAASDADRGDNAKIIYSIMDEIRFRIDNYTGLFTLMLSFSIALFYQKKIEKFSQRSFGNKFAVKCIKNEILVKNEILLFEKSSLVQRTLHFQNS